MDVEEDTCYLLEEPKPVLAFRLLEHVASEGRPCLCVTRRIPDRVRVEHRIGGSSCVWLSETPGRVITAGRPWRASRSGSRTS